MADNPEEQLAAHAPVAWVSFFQKVRQLEAESGKQVGLDAKSTQEPVAFKVDVDANFPAAELARMTKDTEPPTLAVSFFGLFGASGALPYHYSQLIADRARIKDYALRDFLDLFNHRLLSFFYRCWKKHHFPVAFETAQAAGQEDTMTLGLWALIGNRTSGLADRLSLADETFLYFAGHYSNVRPSADALRSILQQTFGVEVAISEFVGQWMLISPGDQTQIAPTPLGETRGNRLGVDALAGQRIWDIQNRFRIRLGPLGHERFGNFTPLGGALRQLVDCVRRYVGPQFDFDVQVVLKCDEVVGARLGVPDQAALGWNTWMGNWNQPCDAQDAVFELPDIALDTNQSR